jgi:SOS response regulatory protein OraA/RecX
LIELAKAPIEVKKLEMQERKEIAQLAKELIDKGFSAEQAKEILSMK